MTGFVCQLFIQYLATTRYLGLRKSVIWLRCRETGTVLSHFYLGFNETQSHAKVLKICQWK